MSNGQLHKSRRTSRNAGVGGSNIHLQNTSFQYYQSNQQPFYPPQLQADATSYLLPYGAYQHPQQPGPIPFHMNTNLNLHEHLSAGQMMPAYATHTPPQKRPRTALRPQPHSEFIEASSRRSSGKVQRTTPVKGTPGRKTFSDFRIARISIGNWSSDEIKEENETRDSRIRFCFRNSGDKDPDSTLSATEAALLSPDRVSISVCRGTKRIVIPAHHIKAIDFTRSKGIIVIETDGWAAFETAVEMSPTAIPSIDSFGQDRSQGHSTLQWSLTDTDFTRGAISQAKRIEIKLDQQRPLTEPKWTRGSLADHVDINSRFLKILTIVDSEASTTFAGFLDQWASDDTERAYFHEYHLDSKRLLKLLTSLMSNNNVLSPSIRTLLEGMLTLIQRANIPEAEICALLQEAVFGIPNHMLTKSMDSVFEDFVILEAAQSLGQLATSQEGISGSKRQRGESEVPSDQLARTTLDEKRRRLSESEPHLPAQLRDQGVIKPPSRPRSRSRIRVNMNLPRSTQMKVSKSHESALPVKVLEGSPVVAKSTCSSPEDGARMSREEMLRTLEGCEGQTSSDVEPDEQDCPVESGTMAGTGLVDEEWPPLTNVSSR